MNQFIVLFKLKRHQEQYSFNEEIEEYMETFAKMIKKLTPEANEGNQKKSYKRPSTNSRKVRMPLPKGKSTPHCGSIEVPVEAYKVGRLATTIDQKGGEGCCPAD